MKVALEDQPEETFEQPEDIVYVRIDKSTGKLSRKTDKSTRFEYFVVGSEPTQFAPEEVNSEIIDEERIDSDEIF